MVNFINGHWLDGHSGETIELTNPATRKTLAYIQAGDAVDVDLSVAAAYEAFPKWSKVRPLNAKCSSARLRTSFVPGNLGTQ
jgi:acyl-CoA reductase-like NAD-dependent aldehyde dehydrogenase